MAEAPRPAGSSPSSAPRTPPSSAPRSPAVDDLVAVVRVHLDRVHDAVRRVGCGPEQSVDVVETSAVELVEAVATTPEDVDDAAGWWFARARARGHRLATGSEAPLGGGLLAADDDQQRLAEALEQLPERDRVALLLRDSYDLPPASVAAALGTDADDAMAVVARARLALLPLVDDEPAPDVPPHAHDLAALGRLGEAGPVTARDATVRRHGLSCSSCRAVTDAQQRAHLRLAGLTVVALPERARTRVLSRVERAARRLLPADAAVPVAGASADEAERDDQRLFSPLVVGLSLVLSALAGAGLGLLLTDRGDPEPVAGADGTLPAGLPLVSPPAPPPPPPTEVPTVPEIRPRTSVVVVPPPAPPPPPPAPSPTPSPTPAASLALAPVTGPNGTELSVSGAGFAPGAQVQLDYLDAEGEPTGSQAQVEADEDGAFTAQIAAQDPANEPGAHEVVASDGTTTARATFTAEP